MPPASNADRELHQRLLEADPIASAELAERCLGQLLAGLARAFPKVDEAILGDVAVHAKCGDAFWQEIARIMTEHLKQDRYTDAILFAVEKAGTLLAEHFPPGPEDQNELPNEIAGD